jgi:hypothetical protein
MVALWKAGEEDAIAVYRARLLAPFMILTGVVVLAFLVTLHRRLLPKR